MRPGTFRNPFERTAQPPRTVVVIPARQRSTRLPGKPLADIAGRPMIEHVYRRAASAPGVDAVIVATDDEQIAAAVERFGGIVRLTRADHRSGTDRVAEVASALGCELVVNVQGDEPLIEPRMVGEAIEPLAADPTLSMATLARVIVDPADHANPNVVKVVVNCAGDAMYFSRAPIPAYVGTGANPRAYRHVGLYAYRRAFLLRLAALPPTALEQAESLEQLRALEHGFRIHVAVTSFESVSVDTAEDLERVRRTLREADRDPSPGPSRDILEVRRP